jgi:inorganic pyrophosphatase/exopolyphosphatase
MDKFNRYIKDSWKITEALYTTKKSSIINITLGNVSGDMDSVVCSILYSYYLTYKNGFYEEEEEKELNPEELSEERLAKFVIPMLNMKHEDLEARSDILYHFETTGVEKDKIPATNVVDLDYFSKEGKMTVNLVDHNIPDCTQEHLCQYVARIVDHHSEKEADYPKLEHKDVRFCGAAGTLVVKEMLEDTIWKDILIDKHVALFACAPILIDTVNFKEKMRGKKWDQVDEDVFKQLKEIAGDHIPDDYFQNLYIKKTDIETNIKLGFHLLARKDYKNYKLKDGLLGISTIFLEFAI